MLEARCLRVYLCVLSVSWLTLSEDAEKQEWAHFHLRPPGFTRQREGSGRKEVMER